ncbi:MAG: hypothetical protein BWX79_00621 [Alphaproteobacteria bacterium ADurb.Bin100]|nr:MAG: hypothetical protein BWX79_00621 [Alphaproteobacteria bacterium ADurb.Bin100]
MTAVSVPAPARWWSTPLCSMAREDSHVEAVWKLVKRTPDRAIWSIWGVLISLP